MNDVITVVGSLGADPVLKSVNGDQLAEFRLGCSVRRKEGDEWVNGHTNWYSVEAWGRQAPHVDASLRKGDLVIVQGHLKIDHWESGEKRGTSVKIRADHVGASLRVGPTQRQRRQQGAEPSPAGGPAQRTTAGSVPEPEPVAAGGGTWVAPGAEPVFAA